MSWTKRVQHPSEVVKKGDAVNVVILNIDADNKRISLGLKQAEEDPWLAIGEHYPVGKELKGRRIAIWGLAFKPNTDDMREAASLTLIADLLAAGAEVRAYDPVAGDQARKIFAEEKKLAILNSAKEALQDGDALAIVTEWAEFRAPDFALLKKMLRTPAIFDGRNLYDPAMVRALGFEYFPIGRKI